jgi:starch-binding outer membrane protein, SusD/RagB family
LLLRGLSYYDARRWGVIDPVASGGGRKGCWVLDADGNFNSNATFDYQYLNYFPVPANETDLNPPATGSSDVGPQVKK